MHRRGSIAAAALLVLGLAASLTAQKVTPLRTGGGGSPHERVEWTIDGAHIAIEYGRPYLKGRSEAQLMPNGQPWRTGADAATTLTSDKPLRFASVSLPAGTYTISTIPGDQEWQLLLGKLVRPGQWGIPYEKGAEVGRVPMRLAKTKATVEQVTIAIDDTPSGGTLRIEWGSRSAAAPFTVG